MKKILFILLFLGVTSPAYAAVTFDSASTYMGQMTGIAYSYTNNGDFLLIGIKLDPGEVVSSVTYNGSPATYISNGCYTNDCTQYKVETYGLVGAATGVHDIVVTLSSGTTFDSSVASYGGVSAVGASNGGYTAASDFSADITTTSSNSWIAAFTRTSSNYGTGAGTTNRTGTSFGIADSNGGVSAGANSLNYTGSGGFAFWSIVELEESGGGTTTPPFAAVGTVYTFLFSSIFLFLIQLFAYLTIFFIIIMVVGWPIRFLAKSFVHLIRRANR